MDKRHLKQLGALFERLGYKHAGVGEGWYGILEWLNEELAKLDPNYKISQIKEKFGTLRFYADPTADCTDTDKFYALIDEAENKSEKTCESCGKPGKLGGKGWVSVACEECRK